MVAVDLHCHIDAHVTGFCATVLKRKKSSQSSVGEREAGLRIEIWPPPTPPETVIIAAQARSLKSPCQRYCSCQALICMLQISYISPEQKNAVAVRNQADLAFQCAQSMPGLITPCQAPFA